MDRSDVAHWEHQPRRRVVSRSEFDSVAAALFDDVSLSAALATVDALPSPVDASDLITAGIRAVAVDLPAVQLRPARVPVIHATEGRPDFRAMAPSVDPLRAHKAEPVLITEAFEDDHRGSSV